VSSVQNVKVAAKQTVDFSVNDMQETTTTLFQKPGQRLRVNYSSIRVLKFVFASAPNHANNSVVNLELFT